MRAVIIRFSSLILLIASLVMLILLLGAITGSTASFLTGALSALVILSGIALILISLHHWHYSQKIREVFFCKSKNQDEDEEYPLNFEAEPYSQLFAPAAFPERKVQFWLGLSVLIVGLLLECHILPIIDLTLSLSSAAFVWTTIGTSILVTLFTVYGFIMHGGKRNLYRSDVQGWKAFVLGIMLPLLIATIGFLCQFGIISSVILSALASEIVLAVASTIVFAGSLWILASRAASNANRVTVKFFKTLEPTDSHKPQCLAAYAFNYGKDQTHLDTNLGKKNSKKSRFYNKLTVKTIMQEMFYSGNIADPNPKKPLTGKLQLNSTFFTFKVTPTNKEDTPLIEIIKPTSIQNVGNDLSGLRQEDITLSGFGHIINLCFNNE